MKAVPFDTDVLIVTKSATQQSASDSRVEIYDGLPRHQNDPIPKHENSGSIGLLTAPASVAPLSIPAFRSNSTEASISEDVTQLPFKAPFKRLIFVYF